MRLLVILSGRADIFSVFNVTTVKAFLPHAKAHGTGSCMVWCCNSQWGKHLVLLGLVIVKILDLSKIASHSLLCFSTGGGLKSYQKHWRSLLNYGIHQDCTRECSRLTSCLFSVLLQFCIQHRIQGENTNKTGGLGRGTLTNPKSHLELTLQHGLLHR